MKPIAAALGVLICVAAAVGWVISEPQPLLARAVPAHEPNIENGKLLYTAAGCHTCHKAAKAGAETELPIGGAAFKTPIATFYPPNLTPDDVTGLGRWSDIDFLNAVKLGISPSGEHYLPAFPYTSYAKLTTADVLDIKAYLFSLEPVSSQQPEPAIPFLWLVRRGVGLWKRLGFDPTVFEPNPAWGEDVNRGAYLVQGAGHCSECHTPRNLFFVPLQARYLAGGPHPEGKGKVPSLRRLIERGRFKDAEDLKSALQWGEAFGYEDMASGGMGDVQENLSKLPDADVAAIAAYLVSLDKVEQAFNLLAPEGSPPPARSQSASRPGSWTAR